MEAILTKMRYDPTRSVLVQLNWFRCPDGLRTYVPTVHFADYAAHVQYAYILLLLKHSSPDASVFSIQCLLQYQVESDHGSLLTFLQ